MNAHRRHLGKQFARTLKVARTLEDALARLHTATLARDDDIGRTQPFGHAHNHTLDLQIRIISTARHLCLDEIDRARLCDQACEHASELAAEVGRAAALGRAAGLGSLHDHDLDLIRQLRRDLKTNLDLARALIYQGVCGAESRGRTPARRITPSAGRLVVAAARLLPAMERARYSEEYLCELWDIASAGAGRRQQLRYAIHQLLRIASLRATSLTPRRRKASP